MHLSPDYELSVINPYFGDVAERSCAAKDQEASASAKLASSTLSESTDKTKQNLFDMEQEGLPT